MKILYLHSITSYVVTIALNLKASGMILPRESRKYRSYSWMRRRLYALNMVNIERNTEW